MIKNKKRKLIKTLAIGISCLLTSVFPLSFVLSCSCSNSSQKQDNVILNNNQLVELISKKIGDQVIKASNLNINLVDFKESDLNKLIHQDSVWQIVQNDINQLNNELNNKIDINKIYFYIGNKINNSSIHVNIAYNDSNIIESNISVIDITKVNSEYIFNTNDIQIDKEFYLKTIDENINLFINNCEEFDKNLDKLSQCFINIIHSFINLNQFYPNEYNKLNLSNLKLDDNKLNKLIINIENNYFLDISNFCLFENITFDFNQNLLDSLTVNNITNKYNTSYYKKLLSEFIYNGLIKIDENMNDLEKLITVSQYICDFMNADQNQYENSTLYSVLNTRLGVCRHYVDFLTIFLNILKIPNYTMLGNAFENNESIGYHIWNVVKINNQWLVVDLIASDASGSNIWKQNQSGSSMTFKKYFLMGKNNNNRWQVFNSTFPRNPISNATHNSNNLNEYINDNSSFLYYDLWSNDDYNFIFKNFDQTNLARIKYYKNYWYTIVKNKNTKEYQLLKIDLKNNLSTVVWKFSYQNNFDINLQSTIDYQNLYIFKINYNNKTQLAYFDLNDPKEIKKIDNLNNLNFNMSMYINSNELLNINDEIIIDNLDQYAQANTNNIQTNLIYPSIGKVYQGATLIGNDYGQVKKDDINIFNIDINNENTFNQFIQKINFNKNKLMIINDLNKIFLVNPYEYLNKIIKNYGYLKFNFNVAYKNSFFSFDNPPILYEWYLNDKLYASKLDESYLIFDEIKNETDLTNLVGEWKVTAKNMLNNEIINSSIMNFQLSDQEQYLYYPYYLTLKNISNTNNDKNLNICLDDIILLNNTNAKIEIIFNDKVIWSKQIQNHESINFNKDYNELLNSDFGMYQINLILYANDKKLVTTYKYFLYKFINN